jgi:hypothetical protein
LGRGQELLRAHAIEPLEGIVAKRLADRHERGIFRASAELPEHRDSGRAEGVIADPRGDPRRSRALVVDAARAYWAQLRGLRLYMDAAFVLPQLKPVGFAIRTHAPSHRYGFGVVFTS